MTTQIGIVRLLIDRVFPIDPEADIADPGATTVLVSPGDYPVYRYADAVYWMMRGRVNGRGFQKLGDGLFAINHNDTPTDIEVLFPSRMFGPAEFAELRNGPLCVAGPNQRLVFTLDGEA